MSIKSIALPAASTSNLISTTKVSDFLVMIAASVGAADSPNEVQARVAARMALSWLLEIDWDFYMRSSTISVVAGTSAYLLADRTNDIISARVSTSDGRPIHYVTRDQYDQVIHDQTSNSRFTHYTMEAFGSGSQITFLPTPDATETVTYTYFLEPSRALSDDQTGFISEYMELPWLLFAQMLVGQWRGKPQNWVNTQLVLAVEARKGARAREIHYDQDVRFLSAEEHGSQMGSLNVEPSYYERFVG